METRNLDPYQKWETMVDTTSFLGAGALTCALQGVSLIEPTGLGILFTSGASALGIAALSKFLPKDLPFLKVCAAVAAIALTTFSLPFVFAALGTHAFILLTSQTALQLFVINLITKAAAFAIFKAGLFFKNYNNFRLPKTADDIDKLKSSELLEVKNHLLQFPAKTKELPLPYQVSLNKNLKAIGQEQLPIVCYSQVGEEWSKEDVKHLHKEDLNHLTLDQRIEIAELFLNHELAPQKRPYAKEEFPKFDSVLEKKKFSQAAADWVSLLLQLDPKAKISPKILKELKIKRPPKNDVIVLPPVEKGKGYDYYSIFDWRLAGAGVLLVLAKTAHYVANNSFTAANSVLPEKLPGTALIDLGKTVYEQFSLPKLAVKEITKFPSTALIDLGRTVYEKFTIPHSFRLEKLIPAVARPISEAVSQNIGIPVVTEIPSSSSSYLYAAGLLGLGAVTAYVAYRNWGQSEPRAENLVPQGQLFASRGQNIEAQDPPFASKALVAPIPNAKPRQKYVKMEATRSATPDLIIHPNDPENYELLHDQTIPCSAPVLREFQQLLPSPQLDPLEVAAQEPQVLELLEIVDEPSEFIWKKFEQYVEEHCPGIDVKKAKKLAKQGKNLIQSIKDGLVAEEASDDQIVAFCWGAMLHMISKKQAFVEGMIDIEDPNHRIFNFLLSSPSCYGRKSSHYKDRAIPVAEGKGKGCSYFGIDIGGLPARKRTVQFGKLSVLDQSDHTFFKMENFGANLNVADFNAWLNSWQVFPHAVELGISVAKKLLPGVFGEVGGGEYDKKEHLPGKDKTVIKELIKQIREQDLTLEPPIEKEITEKWGFALARRFFADALNSEAIQPELREKIEVYVADIDKRYPNLNQKGDEGTMGGSIYNELPKDPQDSLNNSLVVMEKTEKTTASDHEEDGFVEVSSDGAPTPSDREIAREKLSSDQYLESGNVTTYANFLNERQQMSGQQTFNFVHELTYANFLANVSNNETLINEKLELALKGNDQLVFIPFILEKQTIFSPDHIVLLVLNPKENTYEYYNSQGGDLNNETRTVLGADLPANAFLKKFIIDNPNFKDWSSKFNPNAHQGFFDYTNCGAFVCWFMKYRLAMSFEELCNQKIQIEKEKQILAEELGNNPL